MRKSDAIKDLATSLAKAQSEIKGAVKDSVNPFFKRNYADLESVWDAVRVPLSQNGLSVVQTTSFTPECGTCVITTLLHSSGQWIEGTLPIAAVKNDPQSIGSAITYSRRYALAAMVGVYQTDDDGENGQGRDETTHTISNVTKDQSLGSAVPICCERAMMISKYSLKEFYCPKCKKTAPRAA